MLVQLDHIALTAEDGRETTLLRDLGYEESFSCRSIPNPLNKRDLMAEWADEHALALYERPKSIPIEVIDYGYFVDKPSHFELPYEGFLKPKNSTRQATPTDSTIDTVRVRTSSIDSSQEFWTTLGLESSGENTLQFDDATSQASVTFELRTVDRCPERTRLDASGFPCIAFVTTSLERDRERMSAAGYEVTDVSEIELPHRTMDVSFIIGPDGVPVELVSPR